MTDAQTTYDRATSAYDKDHERALMEAITRTIFETSDGVRLPMPSSSEPPSALRPW